MERRAFGRQSAVGAKLGRFRKRVFEIFKFEAKIYSQAEKGRFGSLNGGVYAAGHACDAIDDLNEVACSCQRSASIGVEVDNSGPADRSAPN
jgi:hypothetical protein